MVYGQSDHLNNKLPVFLILFEHRLSPQTKNFLSGMEILTTHFLGFLEFPAQRMSNRKRAEMVSQPKKKKKQEIEESPVCVPVCVRSKE